MFQMFFFPLQTKDNKAASSPDVPEPPRGCSVPHPEGPPCCRHPLSQSCKCCSFPWAQLCLQEPGLLTQQAPHLTETQGVPAGLSFLPSQGQFCFSLLKLRVAAVFDCFFVPFLWQLSCQIIVAEQIGFVALLVIRQATS